RLQRRSAEVDAAGDALGDVHASGPGGTLQGALPPARHVLRRRARVRRLGRGERSRVPPANQGPGDVVHAGRGRVADAGSEDLEVTEVFNSVPPDEETPLPPLRGSPTRGRGAARRGTTPGRSSRSARTRTTCSPRTR